MHGVCERGRRILAGDANGNSPVSGSSREKVQRQKEEDWGKNFGKYSYLRFGYDGQN